MTANLKAVLNEAKKLATPSKAEDVKVNFVVKDVIARITKELTKQKLDAKVVVGGSVAKGTWLPGISDIDFFLVFDYDDFSDRSSEISNFAEKVLKKVFRNLQRLHGSRDYFAVRHENYSLEFVPVLDISNGQQARNITDYSPLHVRYVAKNTKIKDDVRLAKQFMKAAGVYGAESYVNGFSGHVIEILSIHYGGFTQLLKHALEWGGKEFIDAERHYRNKDEAFKSINKSKLIGPLVVIDPIESDRNAAAALSFEKLKTFKLSAKKFLVNPSLEFFREKIVTLKNLEAGKKGRVMIVFEVKTPKGKQDIIGAKMRGLFEKLQKNFADEEFTIVEKGWLFSSVTRFWFYFGNKPLAIKKLHFGPPINLAKEHIAKFKKVWKSHKISIKNKKYVVELKRKYTRPQEFAKALAKEYKLKLICG
ncbi:MAG: CCA tRNA nucleotidyltransferase [DPANN group archaeon]|nr:CCA tRNA nucleotidyltransferase [DPANN group archaeon]